MFEGGAEVVVGEGGVVAAFELLEGGGGAGVVGAALLLVPRIEHDLDFDPRFGFAGFVAGGVEAPGFAEEERAVGGHGVVGGLVLGELLEGAVEAALAGGGGGGEGVEEDDDEGDEEEDDEAGEEETAIATGGGGGGEGFDAGDGVAELDLVAGAEAGFGEEALAVEEGAVGGEVFEEVIVGDTGEEGVLEGDGGAGEADEAALGTAEVGVAGGAGELLAVFGAGGDFEDAVHRFDCL